MFLHFTAGLQTCERVNTLSGLSFAPGSQGREDRKKCDSLTGQAALTQMTNEKSCRLEKRQKPMKVFLANFLIGNSCLDGKVLLVINGSPDHSTS